MPDHLLAIDQGTTSTRAIVFDKALAPVAIAQQEFAQIYPAPGWVEHDPEEIWASAVATVRAAMAQRRHRGRRDRGDRHHQPARDHDRLGPRDRQADPQRHRLAGPAHGRRCAPRCATRATSRRHRQDRACCSIPISRPPRSPGCSITSRARARRRDAGRLAFGTVDSLLLWRLTGGRVHATDATNASRTLLLDIAQRQLGRRAAAGCLASARAVARGARLRGDFGTTAAALRRRPIRICGVAGDQQAATVGQGCFAPGMMKSTYGTGCFALLNTGDEPVPRATACSRPSPISSAASAPTRSKARSSSPARPCNGCATALGIIGARRRDRARCAEAADPAEQVYLVPAFVGLGAPWWDANARGAHLRADPQHRPRPRSRAPRSRRRLSDPRPARGDARRLAGARSRDGAARRWRHGGERLHDAVPGRHSRTRRSIARTCMETTALGAAYLAGHRRWRVP